MDETTIEDTGLQAVSCGGQVIGDGVKELTILPWGAVKSKKGTFIVDGEACAAIVSAFDGHGVSVPVDFEHESEEKKGRADAIGWIEKLWAVPAVGLRALIRWTDTARKAIRSDAYRYLSPVLLVRKSDRRAVELRSAALTNLPAIPAMERVAASTRELQEKELLDMTDDALGQAEAAVLLGKLRGALGLADDVSAVDVLTAALAKLGAKDDGGGELEGQSVRRALGLAPDVPTAAVVLALRTRSANGDNAELTAMKATEAARIAREHVDKYVTACKINARDAEGMAAAMELARTNPELLDKLMANAASVMPPQGKTKPPPSGPDGRTHVILKAAREHRGDPQLAKQCGAVAFVNLALRDCKMALLSADETREYVAV